MQVVTELQANRGGEGKGGDGRFGKGKGLGLEGCIEAHQVRDALAGRLVGAKAARPILPTAPCSPTWLLCRNSADPDKLSQNNPTSLARRTGRKKNDEPTPCIQKTDGRKPHAAWLQGGKVGERRNSLMPPTQREVGVSPMPVFTSLEQERLTILLLYPCSLAPSTHVRAQEGLAQDTKCVSYASA